MPNLRNDDVAFDRRFPVTKSCPPFLSEPPRHMHRAKQAIVDAYYHLTRPYRAMWLRRACAAGLAPVVSLFYHRVADDRANAWTCSRDVFAQQMQWISRHADVVDLAEAQRRMREGNDRLAVSVTFDDGYAENDDFALPLLVWMRIPCTYFVTLKYAATGEPFPHDMEHNRPLPTNTLDSLRRWSDAGIEIGAHTRTHADLGLTTDEATLYDEMVTASRELGDAVGRPIRYFAFPFGQRTNLSPRAFQLAREAGFAGVCSAYGAYNFPGDDAFHIQRVHADDDMARFRNWVSIDPRKLNVPRYSAEQSAADAVFA